MVSITQNSLIRVYCYLHLFVAAMASGTSIEFHNGLSYPIELVVTQNNVAPQLVATIPTG